MPAAIPILVLAILAVVANVVITIMIMAELNRRGVATSILWVRLYMVKYVHQYRQLTEAETGTPGPLFTLWLVSINSALVFGVVGLVFRAA
jgi:hypothetical protein